MVKRVVAEEEAMMRESPGYDFGTYTFIADYLPWARGDGMEHRNSTTLTSRLALDSAGRVALIGTVAHEFFHAWNMERLRSRALEPFDFDRENMSGDLWFGEGFTNYFDDLTTRRAGFMNDTEYASAIGGAINGVVNSPARQQASAVGMSMLAPFFDGASWLDAPVAPNRFISYYTWGSIIGLGLDLTLRQRYNTTLDEYMRTLWRDFGKHQSPALAPMRPYTRDDLRASLARLTKDSAFANDFFRRYVEGTEVQDFAPLLAQAGFKVTTDSVPKPFVGASMDNDSTGVFINWSSANGSMYAAGINNGDIVHSLDGVPVSTIDSLNAVVGRKKVGDVMQVDFTTRDGRRTVPMKLVGLPPVRVVTYESLGMPVTEGMRTFRRNWLESRIVQPK
jgi:predicted metalloprotease with PDZ domain